MKTLTTADLPTSMTTTALQVEAKPLRVRVLTCEHGPACPACVLAAARLVLDADRTLARDQRDGARV